MRPPHRRPRSWQRQRQRPKPQPPRRKLPPLRRWRPRSWQRQRQRPKPQPPRRKLPPLRRWRPRASPYGRRHTRASPTTRAPRPRPMRARWPAEAPPAAEGRLRGPLARPRVQMARRRMRRKRSRRWPLSAGRPRRLDAPRSRLRRRASPGGSHRVARRGGGFRSRRASCSGSRSASPLQHLHARCQRPRTTSTTTCTCRKAARLV